MRLRIALATVAATCLAAACTTGEARPIDPACGQGASPLARFLTCDPGEGRRIVAARQGCSSCRTYRIVEVDGLPRMVSVAEGYDLAIVEDGRSEPFATLRVERSEPGRYSSDTDIVRAAIAASGETNAERFSTPGVESLVGSDAAVLFFEHEQATITVRFSDGAGSRPGSGAQQRLLERYVECATETPAR